MAELTIFGQPTFDGVQYFDTVNHTVSSSSIPIASQEQTGAVKIGSGLSIENGVVSVTVHDHIQQGITALSSGTVTLSSNSTIYSFTPSSDTTFTFNDSAITGSGVTTFELEITFEDTAYTLTFPATVVWLNDSEPDMTETGRAYILVFRKRGTIWVGNLQGSYSLS